MNILEQIELEKYSTRAQWLADIGSLQYRHSQAFREAIDRKAQRSWEAIKHECVQTPDLNAERVTIAHTHTGSDGNPETSFGPLPFPEKQRMPEEDLIIRDGGKLSIRVGSNGAASQVSNQAKGRR